MGGALAGPFPPAYRFGIAGVLAMLLHGGIVWWGQAAHLVSGPPASGVAIMRVRSITPVQPAGMAGALADAAEPEPAAVPDRLRPELPAMTAGAAHSVLTSPAGMRTPAMASSKPATAASSSTALAEREEADHAVSLAPPALPAAPAYLAVGMDPGPVPLFLPDPLYPPDAGLREGTVVLRFLIDEAGRVDNVAVVRAFPPGMFEASALAAGGAAKFAPGRLLGLPVKSQLTVEVQFTPINRGGRVSGRGY